MVLHHYPLLNEQDQQLLYAALHYMKVSELKSCCHSLRLPEQGKKGVLIQRIMNFIKTGIITESRVIPSSSQAASYPFQPLSKHALMLYGSYKNDTATRMFFKSLIGPHFHFTAFGIDWLNDRWLQGNPPTYQEFATYWIEETEKRKYKKPEPKKEWAYINFLQQNRELSKTEALFAWKKLRAEKALLARNMINTLTA